MSLYPEFPVIVAVLKRTEGDPVQQHNSQCVWNTTSLRCLLEITSTSVYFSIY